jgi:hypothetical protein
VLVVIGESDARMINALRQISRNTDVAANPVLAAAHQGNDLKEGDIVPAIVTAVWGPETINVKAMLDGCDSAWITSIGFDAGTEGTDRGGDAKTIYRARSWHWMFTQQATRYTPNMEELDAKVRAIAQEEVATGINAVARPEDIRTRVDDLVAKHLDANEVNLRAYVKAEVGQQIALQTVTPDERVQTLQERLTVIHAHGNTVQAKHGDSAGFVNVMADLKRLIDTFPTA